MEKYVLFNTILFIIFLTTFLIICIIGFIKASKFQKEQQKKYENCLDIIENKKGQFFQVKNGLSKEEINKVDKNINIDKLMSNLYEKYLELEKKINVLDSNLDNILYGFIKDVYKNKIDNYKKSNYQEINENIELIGYSIIEFNKDNLVFRINNNCYNYKKHNNIIVSGSNLIKVEQVLILKYEKHGNEWLITNYEKVFQKNLSI